MKSSRHLCLAGAAICLWAAWNARDLLPAWRHSPFDRLGWLAALVWLAPLSLWAGRRRPLPLLFVAGLAFSAVGGLAELNALAYAGLALACAGFLVGEFSALLWLASALSWMPAFGYLASPLGAGPANVARLLLALAGSAHFLRKSHA